MKARKLTVCASIAGLLISSLFMSSAVNAGTIFANIPDGGTPNFFNSVKVRTNSGKWTITGLKDLSFTTLSGSYNVTGSQSYKIDATFTNDGTNTLTGGTLTIKGGISELGLGNGSTLFTANLADFNYANGGLTSSTLAFAIDGFGGAICDLGYCSSVTESIYLDLNKALPADFTIKMFKTTGTATTTVPLPAAVWLFGSGLGFLGATAVRRKRKQQIAA